MKNNNSFLNAPSTFRQNSIQTPQSPVEINPETNQPKTRFVHINNREKNVHYPSNVISTTKYNLFTFIPKNLFEQFQRVANLYFLFISLLQLIPDLSPTGRLTTIIPLLIVMSFQALKDAYEDSKRRLGDSRTNNKQAHIVGKDGSLFKESWKDIKCGDIVKVEDRQSFPCDLVLLATSSSDGLCHVETSQLDGETSLKPKRVTQECKDHFFSGIGNNHQYQSTNVREELCDTRGFIESEVPNRNILHYSAVVKLENRRNPQKNAQFPVGIDQMLLRGSTLRNCDFIYGVAVFCGKETKLMKNASKPRSKQSKVERLTNRLIFLLFGLLVLLSLICSIGSLMFSVTFKSNFWYLRPTSFLKAYLANHSHDNNVQVAENLFKYTIRTLWDGFFGFFTFLILFNNLIPISLYVCVEISKFLQAVIISQDLELTIFRVSNNEEGIIDPQTKKVKKVVDVVAPVVRASTLNEELGQIQYIFSDKTGTLTENKMIFKKFSVAGEIFGEIEENKKKKGEKPKKDTEKILQKQKKHDKSEEESIEVVGEGDYIAIGDDDDDEAEIAKMTGKKQKNEQVQEFGVGLDLDDEDFGSDEKKPKSNDADESMSSADSSPATMSPKTPSDLKFVSDDPFGDEISFFDARINNQNWGAQNKKKELELFFTLLAICNTVLIDTQTGHYLASSPDEEALVVEMKELGFELHSRTQNSIRLKIWNSQDNPISSFEFRDYEILNVIEFNSNRKRMSIIVKGCFDFLDGNTSSGAQKKQMVLLCKGADNIVFSLLRKPQNNAESELYSKTQKHLDHFGIEGLRTLLCCYKELDNEDYSAWAAMYEEAKLSIVNREKRLEDVGGMIENDMILVGATAIEDKLQENVPQAIEKLRSEAGIKLWVLTGDKRETAINIGFSANIIDPTMDLYVLEKHIPVAVAQRMEISIPNETSAALSAISAKELIQQELDQIAVKIEETREASFGKNYARLKQQQQMQQNSKNTIFSCLECILSCCCLTSGNSNTLEAIYKKSPVNSALIVDGACLGVILESVPLKKQFLDVATSCKSVICCRTSPKQKANVVKLVKNSLSGDSITTLAIGDGSNDVSMIQEAHVGIGIIGREGLQAANASDYAIPQFDGLARLLLVHGRWNYRRIAKLILYSFYKNATLHLTQFWFVFFNIFSGTSVHDRWTISLFNVFFTFLPIMSFALWDCDLSDKVVNHFPQIYKEQSYNDYFFNFPVFLIWILNAIWHSFISFMVPLLLLNQSKSSSLFAFMRSKLNLNGGLNFISGYENNKNSFNVDQSLTSFFPKTGTDSFGGMYANGVAIYTTALLIVTIKLMLETKFFTLIHHLFLFVSLASWFLFIYFYSSVYELFLNIQAKFFDNLGINIFKIFIFGDLSQEFANIHQEYRIFFEPVFWLAVAISVSIAILSDFTWKYGIMLFFGTDSSLYRKLLSEFKWGFLDSNGSVYQERQILKKKKKILKQFGYYQEMKEKEKILKQKKDQKIELLTPFGMNNNF